MLDAGVKQVFLMTKDSLCGVSVSAKVPTCLQSMFFNVKIKGFKVKGWVFVWSAGCLLGIATTKLKLGEVPKSEFLAADVILMLTFSVCVVMYLCICMQRGTSMKYERRSL